MGTNDYHRMVIRRLKSIRKTLKQPVAILMDLQGPKIRIGNIKENFAQLLPGQTYVLTSEKVLGGREACRGVPEVDAERSIEGPLDSPGRRQHRIAGDARRSAEHLL